MENGTNNTMTSRRFFQTNICCEDEAEYWNPAQEAKGRSMFDGWV